MKKSPAKQRDFKIGLKFFGSLYRCPSCLAGYFAWPQVALTHHVFHRCLYAPRAAAVKFRSPAIISCSASLAHTNTVSKCPLLSVMVTYVIKMTAFDEPNKYMCLQLLSAIKLS